MAIIRNRHTGEIILEFPHSNADRLEAYKIMWDNGVINAEQYAEVTGYHDLTGVDLSGRDLSDADLVNASFVRANLRGTFLNGANLEGAFLVEADLTGASLVGANLKDTGLHFAIFTDADLTDADLSGAKFSTPTMFPDGYDPTLAGAIEIDMKQFPVWRKPGTPD